MHSLMLFADAAEAAPSIDLALRIPLSVLNFLEFAIWGAWFVVLGNYLNSLRFSRKDIGRVYATMALGAIISPMFVGTIADRFFASEQLMGVLHLLGGVLLLWMARIVTPRLFYWVALLYACVYTPTLALSNAIVFANVPASLDFPSFRVLGTIGWIAAGLSLRLFIRPGQQVNNRPLVLAAVLSLILGAYSFFLPHTPPAASGSGAEAKATLGLNAIAVTNGGAGYADAPTVTLDGGEGTGAKAEAQIKDGKVAAVQVTETGRGYTSVPKVSFSGGSGSGAAGQADLKVAAVEIVSAGEGYQTPPALSLLGGDGKEAELKAKLGDSGVIAAVEVAKGGSGYSAPPQLAFPTAGIPFIKAFRMFEVPSAAIFLGATLLITIALAFYYSFTALYLEQGVKVKPQNVGPLMTIGQWVEIAFMLSLSWFISTLGMKWVLVLGMLSLGIGYGIFAARPPLPLIIVGIALHGICFDFFLAAGMIHTQNISPPDIRASTSRFLPC